MGFLAAPMVGNSGNRRFSGFQGYTVWNRQAIVGHTSFFVPHPNLSDEVNRQIVQSEIEGGVYLQDLPPATVLQIQTQHHCYTAVLLENGSALISGHPEFCPEPTAVAITGSTWGGSMLKRSYVGRGMRMEFSHPRYRTPIVTSSIQDIRELSSAARLRNHAAV